MERNAKDHCAVMLITWIQEWKVLQSAFSQPRGFVLGQNYERCLHQKISIVKTCHRHLAILHLPGAQALSGLWAAPYILSAEGNFAEFMMHFHVEGWILQLHTSLITWSPSIPAFCLRKEMMWHFFSVMQRRKLLMLKNEEICEIRKMVPFEKSDLILIFLFIQKPPQFTAS